MLLPDKPKRVVSQAAPKMVPCFGGCGIDVQIRTRPTVYCEPCRLRRKRASSRKAMAKQRPKRGVPEIKGTVAACIHCGANFALQRNASARRCPTCSPLVWKLDAQKRINLAVANNIRASIKSGSKRRRKWPELTGYGLCDLKDWLEAQFLPGMSWDNHGEWHIDHIRPLCSFSFQTPDDPQFREAWALTNLQPLWARDNLSKGGRYTP